MDNFIKIDDLIWRMDNIHESWAAERLSEDLHEKYPTAEVNYDKSNGNFDKAYPIYFWFVDIIFKDESDEAEFILRETQW